MPEFTDVPRPSRCTCILTGRVLLFNELGDDGQAGVGGRADVVEDRLIVAERYAGPVLLFSLNRR